MPKKIMCRTLRRMLSAFAVLFAGMQPLFSQNLYLAGNGPSGLYQLGQFNVETCEFCPEFTIPFSLFSNGMLDVVPLPNGELVVIDQTDLILKFDPPSSTPVSTLNPPGFVFFRGGVLAPNGNVWITGFEVIGGVINPRVYEYNPVANGITVVGELSAPVEWYFADPFFWNGALHVFMADLDVQPPVNRLVSIQIGNPMTVTVVYTYPDFICYGPMASIVSGPLAGIYGGTLDPNCTDTDLFEFDLPANDVTFQCSILPGGYPYGLGAIPAGFPLNAQCQCATDAGSVPTPNQALCAGETLDFTNTGGFLDNNDVKEYILFTNPNDTLGSIVATSTTPSFAFAPPLQTGVTYYFAAMAGNNAGGSVDPDDPCLDFSNAPTVVWRPLPSVVLTAASGDWCAGDCRTVSAVFSGTAPFTLTYTTPNGGSATQTFFTSSGSFDVCVPAGTPPGPVTVLATALTDAFCTCP